jgi:hypothetical protein
MALLFGGEPSVLTEEPIWARTVTANNNPNAMVIIVFILMPPIVRFYMTNHKDVKDKEKVLF